jgi:hypothetical protein
LRRTRVAAVGLIGLVIVAGFSAYASAKPKGPTERAFTENIMGAQISMTGLSVVGAFKVTNPLDGTGAGIQDSSISGTTFPVTGKSTTTDYFADGVQNLKETFTVGTPNANGISTLTGNGKCVGGTGVHKKQKCTYTFAGTDDFTTNVLAVKVTGTYTR